MNENHHTDTVSAVWELHGVVQSSASESKRDSDTTASVKM